MTMKLSEAIRVAEKAKAWLDRTPEYRAAIDKLISVASTQADEPTTRTGGLFDRITDEMRTALDEFTGSLFDLPDTSPAPVPEPVREPVEIVDADGVRALPAGSIYVACSSTGFPERSPRTRAVSGVGVGDPFPSDWAHAYYRVLYRAPASKPAAPKPGDEVPDHEAARALPEGTLIKDKNGMRGIVARIEPGAQNSVRWTLSQPKPEYPATIVDINVP